MSQMDLFFWTLIFLFPSVCWFSVPSSSQGQGWFTQYWKLKLVLAEMVRILFLSVRFNKREKNDQVYCKYAIWSETKHFEGRMEGGSQMLQGVGPKHKEVTRLFLLRGPEGLGPWLLFPWPNLVSLMSLMKTVPLACFPKAWLNSYMPLKCP